MVLEYSANQSLIDSILKNHILLSHNRTSIHNNKVNQYPQLTCSCAVSVAVPAGLEAKHSTVPVSSRLRFSTTRELPF